MNVWCIKHRVQKTLILDCGRCRGEGEIEVDDDYGSYHFERCYSCGGSGENPVECDFLLRRISNRNRIGV